MLLANPRNWFRRDPAPPAFGKDKIVPQNEASFLPRLLPANLSRLISVISRLLSKLAFEWLAPLLYVGASRPLEKDDLWSLPPKRRTDALTDLVEGYFYERIPPDKRPSYRREASLNSTRKATKDEKDLEKTVEENEASPAGSITNSKSTGWRNSRLNFLKLRSTSENDSKERAQKDYPKRPLVSAIHAAFFWRWWIAGLLKLCGDTLNTTTPLVTKLLLAWLTDAFVFAKSGDATERPRGIGYGIGLGIAIFAMQEASSLMENHFMMMTMTNGLTVRSAIIGAICRQITTMISADATQLDISSQYIHIIWIAPNQIIIGIALLINNLGYSALVGLGVLIWGFPMQAILISIIFKSRLSGIQITDRRVRLTDEVLQGIRLVKLYAWEAFYAHQISNLREKEVAKLKRIARMALASLISVVTIVPIAATVLSFITYALSGHELNPAMIFSSLQYFDLIRTPIVSFPVVFSHVADAVVSLGRIGDFLTVEELEEPYTTDNSPSNNYAVRVEGSFTWETVGKADTDKFGRKGADEVGQTGGGQNDKEKDPEDLQKSQSTGTRWPWRKSRSESPVLPTSAPGTMAAETSPTGAPEDVMSQAKEDEKPFALIDLRLTIPKGRFVAIVGRVGSGKSSLLQSLVGEMRKTDGEVVFGGSVAYVPQQPWIMNATLRDNILFGREDDDEAFEKVVQSCSLQHDIDMLPNGVDTEIGEKGINLSGGQKAGVSLARAAYSDSDIVLLDDPLSAVDAHVGKTILENCLLSGPLENKTRVLVTHALHVLAKTDCIYMMENGQITEQGIFQDLMKNGQEFSRLVEGFGSNEETESDEETVKEDGKIAAAVKSVEVDKEKKAQVNLMSEEERNRGAVPWSIYKQYMHAGGVIWAVVIFALLVFYQGASVGNNLFLGFWTASIIHCFSEGDYMGVYAALGVAQALFSLEQCGNEATRFAYALSFVRIFFGDAYWAVYSTSISSTGKIRQFGRAWVRYVKQGLLYDRCNSALALSLFAAGFRTSVNPSKIGVVLSYSLSITQTFSNMVSQFAQNEQNMNAVELVLVYVDLPREGKTIGPGAVRPSWPEKGEVRFKVVQLAYREGLPLVLKGVGFGVKEGEKVGIVGRTGAGKSSLLQALFRIVELRDGVIEIDGVNIQNVDLQILRQRLALVPQDSTLFLGTLRVNLDPLNTRTDAEIISVLRRAWLIPPEGNLIDPATERKFSLDASVNDEGSNYSAGEKQLLALARALLKNSRIIVLDEATSSVDVETDAKLQKTIQTEFSSCTLLCIAHRLKTIVYYDRVLVMDAGKVVEYDAPLALFDKEDSIFRSLCDEANLTREEIVRIRQSARS